MKTSHSALVLKTVKTEISQAKYEDLIKVKNII